MFSNIGFTEFLLIAIVGLLLFGPKKLPELGRALGKTLQEFKNGAKEIMEDKPASADKPSVPESVLAQNDAGVQEAKQEEAPLPANNPRRLPD